ncbi:RPM2 [Candida margitis]|uniref:RPM2 n=1 Tax=Candida margitis TaxID=1775924 RepID=UPI002227461F|nr:RPM2 [Candida margitis]KAI5969103.1 RPM2 [Candida margitis]
MVFPSFIRLARISTRLRHARTHHSNRRHQPFFQASFPYLNTSYYYQGLSKRHDCFHRARWWSKAETGSTSQSNPFLTIADGHYGVYYSMYNHECERKERQEAYEKYTMRYMNDQLEQGDRTKFKQCMFMNACKQYHHHRGHWSKGRHHRWNHRSHKQYKRLFHVKLLLLGIAAKFLISKAIKDTQIGLDNLKTATYRLTSSCYVKPAGYFIHSGTSFHSSSIPTTPQLTMSPMNGDIFSIGLSKRSFTTISQSHFQQLSKTTQTSPSTDAKKGEVDSEDFDHHFLQTQITNITSAFEKQADKQELDIIYPLYQAVKRNDLTLPTVELYNIILKSIIDRPLDGEVNTRAIERKLTNLLTVYQDIIYANLKPNGETYNLVVNAMLDNTIRCTQVPCANYIEFKENSAKVKEFGQITFELLQSSQKYVQFESIFDKVVNLCKLYPRLLSESIVESFEQMVKQTNCNETSYYLNVLEFCAYLNRSQSYNEQEAYAIIDETYSKIRTLSNVDEFAVYQSMMNALVYNNQLNNASQFLDNILIDYKESLQFATRPSKRQVGDLIATFLKAYAINTDVVKSVELLKKFHQVPYLPELPISFYNFIIVKLQEQPDQYDEMWTLYNRIALRKDFQSMSTIDMMKETSGLSCRDALLGFAICKGDHESVFQLVKEIMVKEHLIGDHQVLRMVLDYLNNGVINNKSQGEFFNQYYLGLLHSLLLTQAKHYQTSTNLNDFVSEFVQYLSISVPCELADNDMAVASVTNYNVQLLMNSTLPFKCVQSFDLQTDNLYGLNTIARQVLVYSGKDEEILIKVADFEAHLINQFEDPANHYIELTEEIVDLKKGLETHFAEIVAGLSNSTLAIDKACQYLEISRGEANQIAKISFDQDLSYLLTINYHTGAVKFMDLFEQGFTFQPKTWNALLNQNFINEYLPQIDVASMLDRIWMTGCKEDSKLFLINRLIAYNDETVNQAVAAFVCRENIFHTQLLTNLFQSSVGMLKVNDFDLDFDFELAYSHNSDVGWIVVYFDYLKQGKQFEEMKKYCAIIENKSPKVQLLELEAELETNPSGFTTLLKTLPLANHHDDAELVELLIKHDLKSGVEASNILSRGYPSNAPPVVELLSYTKFLDSLQQQGKFDSIASTATTKANFVSLNHMASSLLASGNLQQMKTIIEENPIANNQDKSQLSAMMLQMLIDAVPHHASAKAIINRFMIWIKFYKLLNKNMGSNNSLPVEHFCQIITLLKLTKSELLSVLTNRIVNKDDGVVADIVNFYFLEVRLFNKESKQQVYNYLETN